MTLYTWVKKYKKSTPMVAVTASQELRELCKRIKQQEKELQILKKSSSVLCKREPIKYAWIKVHRKEFQIITMCKALKVSRSDYYRWLNRKPSQQEIKRNKITVAERKYHAESDSIYGYIKVLEDIQEHAPELACAPETIRLIMQKEYLFSCVKRKFKNVILGEESYY